MKMRGIIVTTTLVLAIIAVFTTTAAALSCSGDIYVNQSGWWRDGGTLNASGTSIQAAVSNANAGETICVAAGSYTENVNVNKRLTLRGEGADLVTVTAASSSDHVFKATTDYVNISGFTAAGATGSGKAGIYLRGRQHCNISENNCSNNYWGIHLYDSSNYNTLLGNDASSNNHYGVRLLYSNNNTLLGNTVNSNAAYYGIHLSYSSNNTLLGNTVSLNDHGIYLRDWSNYNTLRGNTVSSNNGYGINLCGSCNNTLVTNNVTSNKYGIVMYTLCNNNMLRGNRCSNNAYHGIGLLGLNNTCVDNNCSYNYLGIDMYSSSNSTISGNLVSNNHCGIDVSYSSNNTLLGNNASSNNYRGIEITSSSNNTLVNNTANSNGGYGIHLRHSSNYNTLVSNDCSDNVYGTYITSSSNNTLLSNTANLNSEYGIYLYYSSNDNLIYNNYFDNTKNAYDTCINQWNITKTNGTNIIAGPFLGGNYWGDYAGVDNDGDGLGDTMLPYSSSGDITNGGDYHPLVSAAVIPCDGDIYVNQSGWWRDGGVLNASATPIQAAVNNATAGETICVAAGNYTENVNVNKRLTLAGEGADLVTVTAASSSDYVFEVTADYVNISGFTAAGATESGKAGIYLRSRQHCNISENNCSNNYWGICLYDSSNYNTLLGNNASSNNHYGIRLLYSSNNTLVNNTVNSNGGYGIHLSYSSNYNTLVSNDCSDNVYGIYMTFSSDNTLLGNTVNLNNVYGIYLQSSRDNDVTCNLVQNNIDCGIRLTSGSTGNNIAWNNIVANGELQTDGSYKYQFKNHPSDGVDAINNFWGAGMNNSTIDASIYDDEEGRAEVKFYPFETEPVPCAPAPISEESPVFTTADAVIALRIAVGSLPLDLHYDVSGDGQVTSLDALMIAMDARTG